MPKALAPKPVNLSIAKFKIKSKGKKRIEAAPVGGTLRHGDAFLYSVQSPFDWSMTIAYMVFSPEQRDIRCIAYSEKTPELLHRLVRGLRMSVKKLPKTKKDRES